VSQKDWIAKALVGLVVTIIISWVVFETTGELPSSMKSKEKPVISCYTEEEGKAWDLISSYNGKDGKGFVISELIGIEIESRDPDKAEEIILEFKKSGCLSFLQINQYQSNANEYQVIVNEGVLNLVWIVDITTEKITAVSDQSIELLEAIDVT
jgi:hypothetical protein